MLLFAGGSLTAVGFRAEADTILLDTVAPPTKTFESYERAAETCEIGFCTQKTEPLLFFPFLNTIW